jgi:Ca-activated chloride channel family protein
VKYGGQDVWSKMNGQILGQIATESSGAYIPAGTKRVNMSDVYHGYIASVEQTEFETAKINAYIARFQWFAAPALALLLLEAWLSTTRPRSAVDQISKPTPDSGFEPATNRRAA